MHSAPKSLKTLYIKALFWEFFILLVKTLMQYSKVDLSPYAVARFCITSEVSLIKMLYPETPDYLRFLVSAISFSKRTVSLYLSKSKSVSSWVTSDNLEMVLNGQFLSYGSLNPFLLILVIISLQIFTINTLLSPSAVRAAWAIAM